MWIDLKVVAMETRSAVREFASQILRLNTIEAQCLPERHDINRTRGRRRLSSHRHAGAAHQDAQHHSSNDGEEQSPRPPVRAQPACTVSSRL